MGARGRFKSVKRNTLFAGPSRGMTRLLLIRPHNQQRLIVASFALTGPVVTLIKQLAAEIMSRERTMLDSKPDNSSFTVHVFAFTICFTDALAKLSVGIRDVKRLPSRRRP